MSDTDKQPDSEQLEEAVQSPENTANTEAGAEAQPQDDATATETNAGDELEALKEKLAQAEDQVLRAAAEAQNARRRAEQEVEKARKFALERFAGDLLPVVDNLERALDTVASIRSPNTTLRLSIRKANPSILSSTRRWRWCRIPMPSPTR